MDCIENESSSLSRFGIRSRLFTRLSFIGGVFPVGGYYSRRRQFSWNLGVGRQVMSRFDLATVFGVIKQDTGFLSVSCSSFEHFRGVKGGQVHDCQSGLESYLRLSRVIRPVLNVRSCSLISLVYQALRREGCR